MSAQKSVAKNRWHKGVSASFRKAMRRTGVSFDEEQAQFILGGMPVFVSEGEEFVALARDEVIGNRHELMSEWEAANPNRNPYAPSFPERVLSLVRVVQAGVDPEGMLSPDGMVALLRLEAITRAETKTDPFSPPDDLDVLLQH